MTNGLSDDRADHDLSQALEHLKLLAIFHYVVGGLAACVAMFPCLHLVVGIGLIITAIAGEPPDRLPLLYIGSLFIGLALAFILVGLSLAICLILAGRNLMAHRRHNFCLVAAGIECIFMPFGTILGVFTIITLTKPETKALFDTPTHPRSR